MVKAKTMKLRGAVGRKLLLRDPLTNQANGLGAILRATSIEHRAGLVTNFPGSRASLSLAKATIDAGAWLIKSASISGGVMVVARKKGLLREWRGPPDPWEKSPEQGSERQRS